MQTFFCCIYKEKRGFFHSLSDTLSENSVFLAPGLPLHLHQRFDALNTEKILCRSDTVNSNILNLEVSLKSNNRFLKLLDLVVYFCRLH